MPLPMPFDNPSTYPGHSGVDFPQPRGTAIRALGPGHVLRIRRTDLGGWWTTVAYDNGAVLGSAHQDAQPTVVTVGQRVVEGQVIGYVGSLGANSTGPHLHLTDVNNQTYAATMAQLDPSRVVGQPVLAGNTTPITPNTGTEPEEEGDMRFKFGHRSEGTDEWMIVHPQLKNGYLVTTSETRAIAWARLHGRGWLSNEADRYDFDVNRRDYIAIQDAAKASAAAWRAA